VLAIGVAYLLLLLVYIFLRSHGGKGASISFKVPPYSTPEGKKMRVEMGVVLLVIVFAAGLVTFWTGQSREEELVGILTILGVASWQFLRRSGSNRK
jgi:hypothetical protein